MKIEIYLKDFVGGQRNKIFTIRPIDMVRRGKTSTNRGAMKARTERGEIRESMPYLVFEAGTALCEVEVTPNNMQTVGELVAKDRVALEEPEFDQQYVDKYYKSPDKEIKAEYDVESTKDISDAVEKADLVKPDPIAIESDDLKKQKEAEKKAKRKASAAKGKETKRINKEKKELEAKLANAKEAEVIEV